LLDWHWVLCVNTVSTQCYYNDYDYDNDDEDHYDVVDDDDDEYDHSLW
jgi:hypothetical protein